MVDLLQMLLQYLNVNCSIVNCYYPNMFEGLFYLVLLPSLLIVLFVWFISSKPLERIGGHPGLRILLAVVIYIYIVLQGWYTIFISMSQIWIILVIILGVLYFVLGRRAAGAMSATGLLGKAKEYGKKRGVGKITGEEKTLRSDINRLLGELKKYAESYKKAGNEEQRARVYEQLRLTRAEVEAAIEKFRTYLYPLTAEADKYKKVLDDELKKAGVI